MELRALRYFLTIAREENFSKAAEMLHVTQPTMSRQISQMEDELGVKLFRRSTRNVVLTNEGMLFRRRAEEILSLLDKAEQEVLQPSRELEGTVSIGAGEFESFRTLADLIDSFSQKHPWVHYEIRTLTGDIAKEYLDRGLIDVALMLDQLDPGEYRSIALPAIEETVVFMRPDDPLSQLTEIKPADLAGKPLIIPTRSADRIKKWMGRYYDKKSFRFMGDFPHNFTYLVKKNAGYLMSLSGAMPFYDAAAITSRPVHQFTNPRVYLTWKRRQPNSPTVEAFIDHIQQALGM